MMNKLLISFLAFACSMLSATEPILRRADALPGAIPKTMQKDTYEKIQLSPEFASAGTLSLWICPDGWDNSDPAWHFFCVAGEANQNCFWLYRFPDGRLVLLRSSKNLTPCQISTRLEFKSGQWTHIAVTWEPAPGDKTQLNLYADGKLCGKRICALGDNTSFPTEWRVGDVGIWKPLSKFQTTLGRVEIHTRALNSEEISSLAQQCFQDGILTQVNRKFTPGSTNVVHIQSAPGATHFQARFSDELGQAKLYSQKIFPDAKGLFSVSLTIPDDTVETFLTVLREDSTSPVWKITGIDYADYLPPYRADFWHATWIWAGKVNESDATRYFLKEFDTSPEQLKLAAFQWASDERAQVFVNGVSIGKSNSWAVPQVRDNLLPLLKNGKNLIAIQAFNSSGGAGLFGELSLLEQSGKITRIGTDATWKAAEKLYPDWNMPGFDASDWGPAVERMRPPQAPYGDTPYRNFAVLPQLKLLSKPLIITGTAGSKFKVETHFSAPPRMPDSPIDLCITLHQRELYRIPAAGKISGNQLHITSEPFFPEAAIQADYGLKLSCRGLIFPDEGAIGTIAIAGTATSPKLVTKVVTNEDGSLQLQVNGKPTPLMLYRNAINFRNDTAANRFIRGFDQIGVRLAEINVSLEQLWKPDGSIDTNALELFILSPIFYAPNTNLMLFININAPQWYLEKYPDVCYHTDSGPLKLASFASSRYSTDVAAFLQKLVTLLKSRPYYNRIAGFGLDGGEDGQFMQWTGRNLNYIGDYSPAMKTLFHAKMKEKYTSIDKLNAAWHTSHKDFDNIEIPSAVRRKGNPRKLFLDPVSDADITDFHKIFASAPADFLLNCAKTIKSASDREKITAAYYGKFFSIAGYLEWGELAITKVLASPDIDYMIAVEYMQRGSGMPHSISALTESYTLHKKLFVDEADIRTFLSGAKDWGYAGSCFETVSLIRKMFTFSFVRGHGIHWYDLHGGVFENKAILNAIGNTYKVAQKPAKPMPKAEIAVIADEDSFLHTTCAIKSLTGKSILHLQNGAFGRMGAPFDLYFASDLCRSDFPAYKLYIFLNLWAPSPHVRAAIEALKSDGRVLVFLGNAGMIAHGTLSPQNTAQLTGIAMRQEDSPLNLTLKLDPATAPEPLNRLTAAQYASCGSVNPVMLPVDSAATVFGALTQNPEIKPMAIRKFPQWTSVFSACPTLTPDIYRALAQLAKVHIYASDTDTMLYIGRGLLGIHSGNGGNKSIQWPCNATFTDAITGTNYGQNVQTLTLHMLPNETKVISVSP